MKVSEAHSWVSLGAGVADEVDTMSQISWARSDIREQSKLETAICKHRVATGNHNIDEEEKGHFR